MAKKTIPEVTEHEDNPNAGIEVEIADAADIVHELWKETTLPAQSHNWLARIEDSVDAANALHCVLENDERHSEDARDHGVKYSGLNNFQRFGLLRAQKIILMGLSGQLEKMRRTFSQGGEA